MSDWYIGLYHNTEKEKIQQILNKKNDIQFEQAFKKYKRLIWYVAYRNEITGVLSIEDLYQEGCILLYNIVKTYEEQDVEPVFRKSLPVKMIELRRQTIQQCRDYRKQVPLEVLMHSTNMDINLDDEPYGSPFELKSISIDYDQSTAYERVMVKDMCNAIARSLKRQDRKLFRLMISPSYQFYKYYRKRMKKMKRSPGLINIYAKTLSWEGWQVQESLLRIRNKAKRWYPQFK